MYDFGERDLWKRPLHLCLSTLRERCVFPTPWNETPPPETDFWNAAPDHIPGWSTLFETLPSPYFVKFFWYPKHQGDQPSGSARHPQQRWDCDTYYDPDADQTSGMSYTCHGGFSDGAPSIFSTFFSPPKNKPPELGWTKKKPSKDLMFWKVVRHPIELLQVLNSLIASSSTFLQLKHEAALVFSQPTVVPILLDFGNLTGMDPTQRQVLEARARVRGSFWKGRKGSSCFFLFSNSGETVYLNRCWS